MEIQQLKDGNTAVERQKSRDVNNGWKSAGEGGDLNASPPNPGDWPILITPQILTQSSNSDDHLCASNASTQSDHNRSKQIGEFHATLIGTRTKQQQELLRKLNSRVCLKSFRTRTTGAAGNGPIWQVEHVRISSNGAQSGIKVKVETNPCCIVLFHHSAQDKFLNLLAI